MRPRVALQVGAHGTGAAIPPMDEQVVAMTLVTPGRGTLRLSAEDADPALFYMARVGLGALGVVSEVTLQAVPAHRLLERTFVSNMKVRLARGAPGSNGISRNEFQSCRRTLSFDGPPLCFRTACRSLSQCRR